MDRINEEILKLFDKPLEEAWAQLMLGDKFEGLGTTKKCLEKLRESEFLSSAKKDIENGEDINKVMIKYFIEKPVIFDGTGIQKDPYDDFVQSQPYLFMQTKKPNCLGRAIIVASIYPDKELRIIEVLKTKQLDKLFEELGEADSLLRDDEIYESVDYDGSPIKITGKMAKVSILEGILYNEEPHPTIITQDRKILDPVEAEYGEPVGIEYNTINGITAMTMNNLCGFVGLFGDQLNLDKAKEADSLLEYALKTAPKSVILRRNKILFANERKQYEILKEIEDILSEYGVDLPHNLYVTKAYLQTKLGKRNEAMKSLRNLREKYILADSLKIIERNVPLLGYVRMVLK